jgi:hypothetical protein
MVLIALTVLFVGGALYLGGYALVIAFLFLHGAYKSLLQTVITFFIAWGILSVVVNFLEGGRDKYGWAAFVALIIAIGVGGICGMDADTKSHRA